MENILKNLHEITEKNDFNKRNVLISQNHNDINIKIHQILEKNPKALNTLSAQRNKLIEFADAIIECYHPSDKIEDNYTYEQKLYVFIASSNMSLTRELHHIFIEEADDFIQIVPRCFDIQTPKDALKTRKDFEENMFYLTEEAFNIIEKSLKSDTPKSIDDKKVESISHDPIVQFSPIL